jgi:hypothetical protein
MARKRHTAEHIISKLSEAEVALAQGVRWARSAESWGFRSRPCAAHNVLKHQ